MIHSPSQILSSIIQSTASTPFRRLHHFAAVGYPPENPYSYDLGNFSRMRDEIGWYGTCGWATTLDIDVIDAVFRPVVRKWLRSMSETARRAASRGGGKLGVDIHDFLVDQIVRALFHPFNTVIWTFFQFDYRQQLIPNSGSSSFVTLANATAARMIVQAHGWRGLYFGYFDSVLYALAKHVLRKGMAPVERAMSTAMRRTPGFLWRVFFRNICVFFRFFLLESLAVWMQVRLVNKLMPAICAANPGKGVVAPIAPLRAVPMFALRGVWAGARLRILMKIAGEIVSLIADRLILDRMRRTHM